MHHRLTRRSVALARELVQVQGQKEAARFGGFRFKTTDLARWTKHNASYCIDELQFSEQESGNLWHYGLNVGVGTSASPRILTL